MLKIPLPYYAITGLIGLLVFLFYLYHKEVEHSGALKEANAVLSQQLNEAEESNRKLNSIVALNASKSLEDEQQRQALQDTINKQRSAISQLQRLTKVRNNEEQTPANGDVDLSDSLQRVLKQAYCSNPTSSNSPSCKPSK